MKRQWIGWLAALPLMIFADAVTDAQAILNQAGVKGGLIVQVDCGSGSLLPHLGSNEAFAVHGLTATAASVPVLRAGLRSAGCTGRIQADSYNGTDLPYCDDTVNLLILGENSTVPPSEAARVLTPGGVQMTASGASWIKTVNPRPAEMDAWTHRNHAADQNRVSTDSLLGAPRHFKWEAGPRWGKAHIYTPAVLVAVASEDRVFYIHEGSPAGVMGHLMGERWYLTARDAFNGKLLWRKELSNFGPSNWDYTRWWWGDGRWPYPEAVKSCFVTDGDHLYGFLGMADTKTGQAIVKLDAATGEVLHTFASSTGVEEVLLHNGMLFFRKSGEVRVVNPETGATIKTITQSNTWRTSLRGNRLCILSSTGIRAYDIADNFSLEWTSTGTNPNNKIFILQTDDVVVARYNETWRVYSADTGTFLWDRVIPDDNNNYQGTELVLAVNGKLWMFTTNFELGGFNPLTGAQEATLDGSKAYNASHHRRCWDDMASETYLLAAQEGIELIPWDGGDVSINNWVRGACQYGAIAANGMFYAPPHACGCFAETLLHSFAALSAAVPPAGPSFASGRLTTGAAYGTVSGGTPAATDWPTYRQDGERSGSVACSVPKESQTLWTRDLGEGLELTPPVMADNRVYVASKTSHRLYALSADTGGVLWTFDAGGLLDGPPTVSGDCVVFGCADGRVYCLRASDGATAWIFHAAPRDNRSLYMDELASVWPVTGSVLVKDAKVWFGAGRASRLDGGFQMYALDIETGAVVASNTVHHESPVPTPSDNQNGDDEGMQNDILVEDGGVMHMRNYQFDSNLAVTRNELAWNSGGGAQPQGVSFDAFRIFASYGFLDPVWMHRAYWSYNGIPAQMLVVDDNNVYGVKTVDEPGNLSDHYRMGEGYVLFAQNKTTPLGSFIKDEGALTSRLRAHGCTSFLWWHRLPVRTHAIVKAGNWLLAAGPPDVSPTADPFGAFEGRLGGTLYTLDPDSGEILSETELDAPPVYDGLIAADHRLFMSCMDGTVVCMGRPEGRPAADPVVSPRTGTTSTTFYFDGTRSESPRAEIASYRWSEGGSTLSTAAAFSGTFAAGGHRMDLRVTDDDGNRGENMVTFTVLNSGDADGNGLPDTWEQSHGGPGLDPEADTDGDGLDTMDEYVFGTDPDEADSDGDQITDGAEVATGTSPSDPQAALSQTYEPGPGGSVILKWPGREGVTYTVWASSNLQAGFSEYLATDIAATPPVNQYVLTNSPALFTRVVAHFTLPAPEIRRAPVPLADKVFGVKNQTAVIDVLANDTDPDAELLSIQSVTQPANGSTVIASGKVNYTPDTNWTGTDIFTYLVKDSSGLSAQSTVTVYVATSANAIDDGACQKDMKNTSSFTQAQAGKGFYTTVYAAWGWDEDEENRFGWCVSGTGKAIIQSMYDNYTTKNSRTIRFDLKNQGTDNVFTIKLFGQNTDYSMTGTTLPNGTGTKLYERTISGSNFDWTTFSDTVDLGAGGYKYLLLILITDGVDGEAGDIQKVDNLFLGID